MAPPLRFPALKAGGKNEEIEISEGIPNEVRAEEIEQLDDKRTKVKAIVKKENNEAVR